MAHWSRVITEADAPEWTSIRHPDGAVSEVKISVSNDVIYIHVDKPGSVNCIVTGHEGTAREAVG